jgi:hypothetical protein
VIATTCPLCVTLAHDWATDNMIDHVGIRIAPTLDPATGRTYNMARELTEAEQAEADAWAEAWLADGLLASTGSDCGGHA